MTTPNQSTTTPAFDAPQLMEVPAGTIVAGPPEEEEKGEAIEDAFAEADDKETETVPDPKQEPPKEEEEEDETEEDGETDELEALVEGEEQAEEETEEVAPEKTDLADTDEFQVKNVRDIRKARDLRQYSERLNQEYERKTKALQEAVEKASRAEQIEERNAELRTIADAVKPEETETFQTEVEAPWKRTTSSIGSQLQEFTLGDEYEGTKVEDAFMDIAATTTRAARREKAEAMFGADAGDVLKLATDYRVAWQQREEKAKEVRENLATVHKAEVEKASRFAEESVAPVRKELRAALGNFDDVEELKPYIAQADSLVKLALSNGNTPLRTKRAAQAQVAEYMRALPATVSKLKAAEAKIKQYEAILQKARGSSAIGKRTVAAQPAPRKTVDPVESEYQALEKLLD